MRIIHNVFYSLTVLVIQHIGYADPWYAIAIEPNGIGIHLGGFWMNRPCLIDGGMTIVMQ